MLYNTNAGKSSYELFISKTNQGASRSLDWDELPPMVRSAWADVEADIKFDSDTAKKTVPKATGIHEDPVSPQVLIQRTIWELDETPPDQDPEDRVSEAIWADAKSLLERCRMKLQPNELGYVDARNTDISISQFENDLIIMWAVGNGRHVSLSLHPVPNPTAGGVNIRHTICKWADGGPKIPCELAYGKLVATWFLTRAIQWMYLGKTESEPKAGKLRARVSELEAEVAKLKTDILRARADVLNELHAKLFPSPKFNIGDLSVMGQTSSLEDQVR